MKQKHQKRRKDSLTNEDVYDIIYKLFYEKILINFNFDVQIDLYQCNLPFDAILFINYYYALLKLLVSVAKRGFYAKILDL